MEIYQLIEKVESSHRCCPNSAIVPVLRWFVQQTEITPATEDLVLISEEYFTHQDQDYRIVFDAETSLVTRTIITMMEPENRNLRVP